MTTCKKSCKTKIHHINIFYTNFAKKTKKLDCILHYYSVLVKGYRSDYAFFAKQSEFHQS